MAILPLRVQHRHSRRNLRFRKMMVADDYVNALGRGIFYLVNGLDSAVQCYNEPETVFRSPVDTLFGHAIALVISVGNVEIHRRSQPADKRIDQCHCCSPVHVIVSIDENLLIAVHCLFKTLHRLVHILHQERVMDV